MSTFLHNPTMASVEISLAAACAALAPLCAIAQRVKRDKKHVVARMQQGHTGEPDADTMDAISTGWVGWSPLRAGIAVGCALVFVAFAWFGLRCAYILHCWKAGGEQAAARNYAAAEARYRSAISADAAVAKSHILLAGVLSHESKVEEATLELYAAASLDQTDVKVRILLGDVLVSARRPAQAEPIYRQAIAIAPNMAEAHVKLGGCLLVMHQVGDAAKEFHDATLLDPKNVQANTNLGYILLANRRRREGIDYLKRAVDAAPNDFTARNNLAMAYIGVRKYTDAAAQYRAELNFDPNYGIAYFNLGNALKGMHDSQGAIQAYRSYLRICSTRPDMQVAVVRALAEIKSLTGK